jgi:hypothetical protein
MRHQKIARIARLPGLMIYQNHPPFAVFRDAEKIAVSSSDSFSKSSSRSFFMIPNPQLNPESRLVCFFCYDSNP